MTKKIIEENNLVFIVAPLLCRETFSVHAGDQKPCVAKKDNTFSNQKKLGQMAQANPHIARLLRTVAPEGETLGLCVANQSAAVLTGDTGARLRQSNCIHRMALLQIATGSEDQVDSRPGLRYAAIPKRAWMN